MKATVSPLMKWKPIKDNEGREGFFCEAVGWVVFQQRSNGFWLAFHITDLQNHYGPYENAEEAKKWARRLQEETEKINAKRQVH